MPSTLCRLPDPLGRISHQAHTVCLRYKHYSTLFPFSCVSHPQDGLCLRPCHSPCALHEPRAISEAQQVLTLCAKVIQWLFIELLQKLSHPCPQVPGCNCSSPFLVHTPLGEADESHASLPQKMQHPIKFYILLEVVHGLWVQGLIDLNSIISELNCSCYFLFFKL